jgi:hypothetical protein
LFSQLICSSGAGDTGRLLSRSLSVSLCWQSSIFLPSILEVFHGTRRLGIWTGKLILKKSLLEST